MLFSAPMVRAILDGRKTMTRRVVKPQPDWLHPGPCYSVTPEGWQGPLDYSLWAHESDRDDGDARRCPYGQPGERLWVRETFAPNVHRNKAYYRADCTQRGKDWILPVGDASEICITKWTPAIHMPRWASRITLEVTGVRVERLQDISEDDAIAEGIGQVVQERLPKFEVRGEYDAIDIEPVDEYRDLWESINGPGSWALNPWVWVVEFQKV